MDRIDFTKAIIKRYQKDAKTSSPHDVRPAPHNNTLSKATTRMAEHFLLGIPLKPFLKQPWIHGLPNKQSPPGCVIFLLGYPYNPSFATVTGRGGQPHRYSRR